MECLENGLVGGQMTGEVVTTRSEPCDNLMDISKQVDNSLAGARAYLQAKFKFVEPGDPSSGGGWSQFLDEQTKPASVTGTAHGIMALLACGEPLDSEIIMLSKRLIVGHARSDGGWTRPELHEHCSLTRISGLALRSLINAAEGSTSPAITGGIEWLIKAQNDDGGWGNLATDQCSDVTSTSFALQALTRIPGLRPEGKAAINRGRAWVLSVVNQDHSWGYTAGKKGTVAHTSEAIEGLLACGEDCSSFGATRDWLAQHIHENPQFIERYLITAPSIENIRVVWTQVSQERGLIALLRLGARVTAPEVVNSVRWILERQVDHKYWLAEAFGESEPVWAIKEAAVSLRLFHDTLDRDRAAITMSDELVAVRSQLDALRTRVGELESRIERQSMKARLTHLLAFMKKPVSLMVLLTIVLITVYMLFRYRFDLPPYADNLVGILAIISIVLTLYQTIRPWLQHREEE